MLLKFKEACYNGRDQYLMSFYSDKDFTAIKNKDKNCRIDIKHEVIHKNDIILYLNKETLSIGSIKVFFIKTLIKSKIYWIYQEHLEEVERIKNSC